MLKTDYYKGIYFGYGKERILGYSPERSKIYKASLHWETKINKFSTAL